MFFNTVFFVWIAIITSETAFVNECIPSSTTKSISKGSHNVRRDLTGLSFQNNLKEPGNSRNTIKQVIIPAPARIINFL